jgi:hypothetical protein
MVGFYVVGLMGEVQNAAAAGPVKWEIRHDWEPDKGYHVNLHITTFNITKVFSFESSGSFATTPEGHSSFIPGQTKKSFADFLCHARTTTICCGCYADTRWQENAQDAWEGEVAFVEFHNETAKKNYAQALWDGWFGGGGIFQHKFTSQVFT